MSKKREFDAATGQEEYLRRIRWAKETGATTLDLSGLELASLTPEIGNLTALKELYLNNNQLTSVPETLGNLTALQTLSLNNNQLTSVPETLGNLTALQTLSLNNNQLTSVPETLGNLTALQTLFLLENQLTSVPETLGNLTALQSLRLDDNQLTSVPETLGNLTALQSLRLDDNQLTLVPETLGNLTALQTLYLHNNQLTSVPEALRNCTKLAALFLHGNEALGLTPEVLGPAWNECEPYKTGVKPTRPAEILNYYYSLRAAKAKGKTRRLNEAKLLLVGQGGVGKTSLVRRLVDGDYDPHESKTEGIGRTPWKIDSKHAGEQITLNVWDFGGQEIMHATHQFFLTKRSIYLVVLDARKGENEGNIHYWLRIIQTFGDDSPVIVVTNKCDGPNDLNLDTTRLRLDYPNIKEFVKTSCESERGLDALRKAIEQQAQVMSHVFDELPDRYFTLKQQLEEEAKQGKYLDEKKYCALCEKNSDDKKADQAFALRLFHDLGAVLNYGDPNDPYHLNHTHILDPEWVTGGVYRLLNNAELFQVHGRLRLRDLGRFLSEADGYPSDGRDFIIGMMKRFQLCFDMVIDDEAGVLIPELLLKDEPHLTWDAEGTLRFEYHYDVLPSGVLPRFIVLSHTKLDRPPTYWRSGAVLVDEGCRILVRGDRDKGRVYIQVQPLEKNAVANQRLALKTARVYFDQIHQTISARAMVPLPDDLTAPAVDYGYLCELARRKGQEYSWLPPGATREYSVGELLNGIESPDAHGYRQDVADWKEGKLQSVKGSGRMVIVQSGAKYVEKDDMSETYINNGDNRGGAIGKSNRPTVIGSFNSQNAELASLVQAMLDEFRRLPADVAEGVAPYIEGIEKEAAKEKPNRGFLEVTRKGLTEAAKTCAEMAPALLTAAGAVVDFVGRSAG